jgi:hypothetical protein
MGNPRLAVLVALAAVAVAVAGCGDGGGGGTSDCTEIGCLPASAQIQLSSLPSTPAVVELCADDECRTVRGTRSRLGRVTVALPESAGEQVRIRVRVRSRGRVLAEDDALIPVESTRPNGPDCPPVCRYARSRMDLEMKTLEHDPTPS